MVVLIGVIMCLTHMLHNRNGTAYQTYDVIESTWTTHGCGTAIHTMSNYTDHVVAIPTKSSTKALFDVPMAMLNIY